MKKIYAMLLVLVCSLTMLQAQAWYVYDGSEVPDQSSDWLNSSNNPGPNMIEDVINDPFISGNKIFRYVQADLNRIDNTGTARKYYRHDFSVTSDDITIVARLRGIDIDSLVDEKVLNIEYNVSGTVRDALVINPTDSTVSLERVSGSAVKVNADLNMWHTYRVTFTGADSISNIYVDEEVVAVVSGKTTSSTTSNNLRMGDGGSPRISGMTDWIIIDTTGAYAPGAGAAIPDSLSTDVGQDPEGKPGAFSNLTFVSKKSLLDSNGYYADSMFVVALQDAGFNVTIPDYAGCKSLSDDFVADVNSADVVVLGRTPGSGDLGDNKNFWNKLKIPIVSMSTYGTSKLGWVPDSVKKVYGQVYGTQEGHVEVLDDTIFHNVTVPGSGNIEFSKDFLSFIILDPEEVAAITGESIITMVNGVEAYNWNRKTDPSLVDTIQFSDYDGYPLMIRWNPHVSDTMFTGSNGAAARAFHYRTLLPGGDDHYGRAVNDTVDETVYGMYYLTETMKTVFVNECAYLAGLEGLDVSDVNTLKAITVSVGTLTPAFSQDVTNYTVDIPAGTNSITINATATDPTATITGTGTINLEGKKDSLVAITCVSEAGTPMVYSVLVKEETVVAGNLIPPGTNKISEYIAKGEYDEYLLVNGGIYDELDPLIINRKITLKAQDTVTLPALDNLPIIKNENAVINMIQLEEGADLTLFGIDIDGMGAATKAISFLSEPNGIIIDGIRLIRCRIHGVTGDLIGGTKADTVTIKSAIFKNTFAYDAGAHGLYIKDSYAEDGNNNKYVFSGLTFWNLGQQLIWIQILTPDCVQDWEFDHMTGWNLSTDAGNPKELIGNSDGGGQYNIQLTNSIFSNQVSSTGDGEGSLRFTTENANGADNTFNIKNIVLHETRPILNRPGSGDITTENVLNADPQFADVASGDFTIGNADYLTAGDNGTVLGALYWAPNFVDDYADYDTNNTSVSKIEKEKLSISVYPMPFESEINFKLSLEKAEIVSIAIFDITGRTIKIDERSLDSGVNHFSIDSRDIQAGTYFYTISTNGKVGTGQILKIK